MRFALNHIATPSLTVADFFALARRLGLTEVEIRNDTPNAVGSVPAEAVKAAAAEAGVTLAVHVATRTVQGRSARVCLFAIGPNRCVELPDPERENGWAVVDTLVRLPKGTVAAKLYVYADGNERRDGTPTGVRTVTEYREISVLRLASSKATTIAASPPQSGRVELSAGSHLLDTVVDLARRHVALLGRREKRAFLAAVEKTEKATRG